MDKMTNARALEIIAAYGAEPEAWPEQERAACEALIADKPDVFTSAMAEASEMDAAMARETLATPAPSDVLIASIIASAPQQSATTSSGSWLASLRAAILPQGQRWPAMAAAASLAIGVGFGTAISAPSESSAPISDEIVYAALGFSDYADGFEELN